MTKIIVGTKFQNKLTILNFLTKFAQEGYFQSKTEFQFKLTILIFWTKFAQKEEFRLETKNVNITIEFSIFELVLARNFSLN